MRLGIAMMAVLLAAGQSPTSASQDHESWLREAEQSFHYGIAAKDDPAQAQKFFHHAAVQYQKLLDAGFDDPVLFVNLGNAHVLADELPEAILAYRQGLHLDPLHAQLWQNLEAARDIVGYTEGGAKQRPAGDDWLPWLPRPSPAHLLYAALALHGLAWVAMAGWCVVRYRSLIVTALLFFLAAGLTMAWWGYLEHGMAEDSKQRLVVVTVDGLALRRGNGPLYPRHAELPVVNRGMEAVLLTERGGWVQAEFPGGAIGWLPRGGVAVEGLARSHR